MLVMLSRRCSRSSWPPPSRSTSAAGTPGPPQIQRAADAAALAGVVWMPDFPTSQTAALAAAARNGFVAGGNITVIVVARAGEHPPATVSITDSKAPRHFSGFVGGDQSLARTATAEYVLPVPLGSPKNTFGTGDLLTGASRRTSGPRSTATAPATRAATSSWPATSRTAPRPARPAVQPGSPQTADYDPTGYLYAVECPSPPWPCGWRSTTAATARPARRPTSPWPPRPRR